MRRREIMQYACERRSRYLPLEWNFTDGEETSDYEFTARHHARRPLNSLSRVFRRDLSPRAARDTRLGTAIKKSNRYGELSESVRV